LTEWGHIEVSSVEHGSLPSSPDRRASWLSGYALLGAIGVIIACNGV
jgi:hypothetical protein